MSIGRQAGEYTLELTHEQAKEERNITCVCCDVNLHAMRDAHNVSLHVYSKRGFLSLSVNIQIYNGFLFSYNSPANIWY